MNPLGPEVLKLQQFCERIEVDEREVRYSLARGIVPDGVASAPGRGNHREFDAGQAFFLAIVLRLKAVGIQTPTAGEIADWCRKIQQMSANGGWDPAFVPFDGALATENVWLLEVADGRYVRIQTDASPSRSGAFEATPWVHMESRAIAKHVQPIVTIQVNLSELAGLVAGDRTVAGGGSIAKSPATPKK